MTKLYQHVSGSDFPLKWSDMVMFKIWLKMFVYYYFYIFFYHDYWRKYCIAGNKQWFEIPLARAVFKQ